LVRSEPAAVPKLPKLSAHKAPACGRASCSPNSYLNTIKDPKEGTEEERYGTKMPSQFYNVTSLYTPVYISFYQLRTSTHTTHVLFCSGPQRKVPKIFASYI
jgi:hypothetical protein